MNRLLVLSLVGLFLLANSILAADPPEGVLPKGADGKPLNLDFETGTLKDWTAEGEAFKGQPIKGDTVFPRRNDNKSQHQGQFWIGGFEKHGDPPQGTLTSVAFKVTHPWGSFLVGGGPWPTTCVELVEKESGKVFFRASGMEEENLRRVAIDLKPVMGKEMFIRVVDKHSGHWGHINFDDFRFHAEKPKVEPRQAQGQPSLGLAADQYKYAGLPPEKAAEAMTVPEGFKVTLFAGEPDVMQPIAMCLDDRGRLWIAEAYVYPRRHPTPGILLPENERKKGDRIVIFEDTDGDGKFDKRTVFMEGLNLVSGLEYGFGGIWVGAAPYFAFIPIDKTGDKPAGPPQILLDGWHHEDTHETLNSFIWGPDGWLYGCHGVFTHSRVGKPGTPDNQRTPINAGIWRYHPTKHIFEVFAHGTSNPWGFDFNDYGQAFCEACVIPHCFHIIQGGRYDRQAGSHFNPYNYADIKTIADHRHYLGATPHGGNNRSDSAGGGHAHCGTMIYLGGAWPAEYRGQMFMGNIHGKRINMDILTQKGSGYVASHGKDFLLANDEWARFINMRYGPDGNVYLIDWYDKQACHLPQPEVWDRTNGRIYKISYRGTKPVTGIDLQKCTDAELVQYQLNDNDWYVRHARRILQERAAVGLERSVSEALWKIVAEHKDERRRLRALWALHAMGSLMIDKFFGVGEHERGWLVRLALENQKHLRQFVSGEELLKVAADPSPLVRLYVTSSILSSLPSDDEKGRSALMAKLLGHAEDATDHNLPLMYWYATEPIAGEDPRAALNLAIPAKVPILSFVVRRIGSSGTAEALDILVDFLSDVNNPAFELIFLDGINQALKGRKQVDMPAKWKDAYAKLVASKNADIRNQALTLAATFGDPSAFEQLRTLLVSKDTALEVRQSALNTLRDRDKELAPVLLDLLHEKPMRAAALKGLASYADAKTPEAILAIYASLDSAEKRDAVATLASRPAYGKALLDAVAAKKVPAADVSADIVRQLRNLNNKDLDKQIADVWGIVRATPADKAREMTRYRQMLTRPYQLKPDLALGRAIFAKTCQNCHTLYGLGGKVGPDITGSNRANLDYLLENILDPSAVIPKEYAATLIELKNGRVVTGIVKETTPAAYIVATATEYLTISKADVDTMKATPVSMMPDDQLKPMKDEEVRALIAYLQSPTQQPLLATVENAKDLFNGKDLTGWDGDPKLWSVENGEIVGKSPGIKKNEFLKSHMVAGDFRLTVKVKLTPNKENSGIQFRTQAIEHGEVRGYQADVGLGWWGKLYEENARGILSDKPGDPYVNVDDWNDYEIIAVGSKIKTFINGKTCVDVDDPKGAKKGIFAFQIHSGGAMEVRFKDLKLEVK